VLCHRVRIWELTARVRPIHVHLVILERDRHHAVRPIALRPQHHEELDKSAHRWAERQDFLASLQGQAPRLRLEKDTISRDQLHIDIRFLVCPSCTISRERRTIEGGSDVCYLASVGQNVGLGFSDS